MKEKFVEGVRVNSPAHGVGVVHAITTDKTFPVIIKYYKYKVVNYYYSQEGINNVNADDLIKKI